MERPIDTELDCSKKCKHVTADCEEAGKSRSECENRYNQCVSSCAFAYQPALRFAQKAESPADCQWQSRAEEWGCATRLYM
jgi:hypothetical protein